MLITTRCGTIEYQEADTGVPLLMVHGSGGGHDQGMAFAGARARQGIRVIAMSRFGYLRTPMPADASPAAQADAHACLLDALRIRQAGILGASAGAPSAMQMAIRHPDRVSALILLVPLAYKPSTLADSAPKMSPQSENLLMRLIGSDFLFWAGLHIARDQVIKYVVATSPEQVATASRQERARVNTMLDNILPISARALGLRADSLLGKSLTRYQLESISAPTLIISTRDDGYGTYASAQYTASQIVGAKFIGFNEGGHIFVGHDEVVRAEIVKFLVAKAIVLRKLAIDTLRAAYWRKTPLPGLLHHSDRGSQYCSGTYRALQVSYKMKTLKTECLHYFKFKTRDQARQVVIDYIEVFYNRIRRHATIQNQVPADYAN